MKYLPVWILGVIILVGLVSGAKTRKPSSDDLARASYLYMEAASSLAQDQYSPAYLLLSRAAELAPDDDEIAALLGRIIIYTGYADSAEFEKSYQAIKRVFFKNTSDAQNGATFINVARKLNRDEDAKAGFGALMEAFPGNAEYALNYARMRALDYLKGDSTGPAEAIEIYDRLEQGTGITDMLTMHRVFALSVMGDTSAMINQIHRFNATAPLNPEVNFYTGSMFDIFNMRDSAIVYYTAACLLDSTFGPAYLAKAQYYLNVGDSARYDAEVIHALESQSLEFDAKYEIMSEYAQKMYDNDERRTTFLNLFANMLDMHPGEAALHYLYGAYLAVIDSTAAASEQFGYAMDLDPDEEAFARIRIQTAVEAQDTAAAIAATRMAMQRFDDLYYPLTGSALLHLTGQSRQAIALLDSFDIGKTANDYQKSVYEQTRGDILHAVGLKDSAYVAYDRALEYYPDNAGVLNNVAYFLSVDGRDLDKAEQYVRRALLFDADNPTYIDTYAWVLFKQKDYVAARRQIDKALEIFNRYDSVPSAIDGILEYENKLVEDEVEEMLTGITDEDDLNVERVVEEITVDRIEASMTVPSEIYDHAGDIYFMNGEPDIALSFWKEALLKDPDNEKIKKKIKNKAYFFE